MWVSLAAVAILLATASSNAMRPGCRRGSIMKRDCNTCVCGPDGSWACTAIVCPRTKRDIGCSSEEMDDPIMKCACVEKGYGSAEDKAQCLRAEAAEKLQVERENRSTAGERVCEPGTTFMKDCNTCQCNSQGTTAVCTLKECHEGLHPARVKRSSDERWVCEPGLTFMKDCNQCQCNKDGTDMVCTMKKCYPVCRPGQMVYRNCNFCICIGSTWKCTEHRCPPEKPLTLCPRKTYDNEYGEQALRFKRDLSSQTSMQPAVCLKPKPRMKDCNTCRPIPITLPPVVGPTTTTTATPLQPVCLPSKNYSKNCNSCTFRSNRGRDSSGIQQHISSPYHSSNSDKISIAWPTLGLWLYRIEQAILAYTNTESPDSYRQIHIPPNKPAPRPTTESSKFYRQIHIPPYTPPPRPATENPDLY